VNDSIRPSLSLSETGCLTKGFGCVLVMAAPSIYLMNSNRPLERQLGKALLRVQRQKNTQMRMEVE